MRVFKHKHKFEYVFVAQNEQIYFDKYVSLLQSHQRPLVENAFKNVQQLMKTYWLIKIVIFIARGIRHIKHKHM